MELEEWKGVNGKRWEVKCYLVYGDIHNSDNYTLNNQYILIATLPLPQVVLTIQFLQEQTMNPINQLTEQERVVLALLATGQRNARIADELTISVRTVENHLYHIFHKLGVSSRIEATLYALRNDLDSNTKMSGISQDI
jgi:DNA-binding CsgD family transcriptional regulator